MALKKSKPKVNRVLLPLFGKSEKFPYFLPNYSQIHLSQQKDTNQISGILHRTFTNVFEVDLNCEVGKLPKALIIRAAHDVEQHQ
jgi:hypothetical protein